jgi:hypothetical protein
MFLSNVITDGKHDSYWEVLHTKSRGRGGLLILIGGALLSVSKLVSINFERNFAAYDAE